jgi:spermidine synthase
MSEEARGRLLATVEGVGNREAVRRLAARTTHRVRLLALDRFVHGFVDLDDPLWLEYEYEILYGALVRALWPEAQTVRCFFIGGGAYTFQRRLLHLYGDDVRVVTAEIDPAVTRVARAHLALADDARHRVVHDDARAVLRGLPEAERFELVFGDAFHDLAVPWHLTTEDFAREVRGRLAPEGVYLLNLIDVFASGRFLGAMVTTLERAFPHVRVLSMGPRDDHAQTTFLVVASEAPLEWGALQDDDGRPLDVVAYDEADRAAVAVRAQRAVLTDDFAPVENLLAPVVRLRAGGGLRARR